MSKKYDRGWLHGALTIVVLSTLGIGGVWVNYIHNKVWSNTSSITADRMLQIENKRELEYNNESLSRRIYQLEKVVNK